MGILPAFLNRHEEGPATRHDWAEAYHEHALVVFPGFDQVDRAAEDEDPELTQALRKEALTTQVELSQTDPKAHTATRVATVISGEERRQKAKEATPVIMSAASAEQLRQEAELADIRHRVTNAFGDTQNG